MTAKMSVLGDSVGGDQERDANSLLLELDKGLRSGKVGEQCEAIVRFPQLFEKYPFPILINSSFVKVADVFRVGNNILRLCVLQVTQQCEKHLEKITNIDEFVRRIYAVIHSNDPIARALTLRTLGSAACIISERKNVHHSIITSLDSHDIVELEAAIYAATLFAAKSKKFASSICGKLSEMIEQLSVPLDMKLKLILVFENMRCDNEIYQKVRVLCTQMLLSHPSCRFVLAVLHTLTCLSLRMVIDIPVQVELLLGYLNNDVRSTVRNAARRDLHLLSRRAPHMWTPQHVECLCDALNQNLHTDLQLGIVKILSTLCQSVIFRQLPTHTGSKLLEHCMTCCYHDNTTIVAAASEMLVGIVADKWKGGATALQSTCELTDTACNAVDVALTVSVTSGSLDDIKSVLVSVVRLCRINFEITSRFVDAISSCLTQLLTANSNFPLDDGFVSKAVALCDGLSAINDQRSGVLYSLVPDLVKLLNDVIPLCERKVVACQILLALTRLVFQGCASDGLPADVSDRIYTVQLSIDGWMSYKMGRLAARYSHHSLASAIFARLMTLASSEHYYFWLSALKDGCKGESCLQTTEPQTKSEFVNQMLRAETYYHSSVVSLKAAATPSHPLVFQIGYAQLRATMLPAFAHVMQACCSFKTSPPPAIAASLAMTTGLEKHRCQHILSQLHKCADKFTELDNKYQQLTRSSFDADSATLDNIQLLQQACRLMVHVIHVIITPTENEGKTSLVQLAGSSVSAAEAVNGGNPESASWTLTQNHVLDLLHKTMISSSGSVLTSQHIDCIQQVAVLLSHSRLCFPRFMFQRLQMTDIKLAVTPPVRTNGDPILIHYDTRLTLKVEGVLQVGAAKGVKRFHDVRSVELVVYSNQQSRSPTLNDITKCADNPDNRMVQTISPHNDYFSAQFLLAFPVTGLHDVHIEASMVDRDQRRWNVGSQLRMTSLVVKSYDEAAQRQQQLKHANQPSRLVLPPPPAQSASARGTTGIDKESNLQRAF